MKAFAIALAGAAAAALLTTSGAGAKGSALAKASIVDSGSTNTAPFRIDLDAAGRAQIDGKRRVFVSKKLANKFFADAREARLHPRPSGAAACMKSASFGTVLRVATAGWESVDLNCPVIGADAALKADVTSILTAAGMVAPQRRVPLPANEPRRVEPSTPPTTQP